MTYRLDVGGWVPNVPDLDKWRKYFAAQVAGRPPPKMSPIKDNAVNRSEPMKVQLVSGVQDAVDRANAELKHIKEDALSKQDSIRSDVKVSTAKTKKLTVACRKKQAAKVKKLKASSNKSVDKSKKKKIKKSKSVRLTTTAKSTLKSKKGQKKKTNRRKNQKTHTKVSKKARQFVNAVLPKDVWGPAKWG